MAADNDLQYDENEAIKFIRDYMPENIRDNYTDDEILNVLDMIWDYYEDNGYLEIPAADTDEGLSSSPAADDLLKYVNKMLGKDKLAVVARETLSLFTAMTFIISWRESWLMRNP